MVGTVSAARSLRRRLIPAVPTIFGTDGTLDAAANERYARWMAEQDVGGVAVWAHTGRGLALTEEQRAAVLGVWTAATDGVVVCGVGVPVVSEMPRGASARTEAVARATCAMAREAKAGGADIVMVHPPTALRALDDVDARVLDVYRAVLEVGLPVLAFYLYAEAGGLALGPETVEAVLALDGVIGIKIATLDSVMTFQDLVPVVRGMEGSLLITGEDRFLGYSLMLGADAALVGIGAGCTGVSAALLAAWFGDDRAAFLELSQAVDTFARTTFTAPMEGYVQRMLWALEADGVIPSGSMDPFAPVLDPAERGIIASAVKALRSR